MTTAVVSTGKWGRALLLCLAVTAAPVAHGSDAGSDLGRGAAIGAFAGLILGFDFFDVAAGALIGAGIGAASDAARSDSGDRGYRDYALEDQADRLSDLQEDQAMLNEEKGRLSAEQTALAQERAALEAQIAARQASDVEQAEQQAAAAMTAGNSVPVADALGEETVAGFEALVRCEHEQAIRHSMPGRLSDNANHMLAARWLEVLIVHDLGNVPDYSRVLELDQDITSEAEAAQAVSNVSSEIAAERRSTGISCS